MIYVPTGYIAPNLFQLDVNGGSAWGASTIAGGDGSRQPSAEEHEVARVSWELRSLYSTYTPTYRSTVNTLVQSPTNSPSVLRSKCFDIMMTSETRKESK